MKKVLLTALVVLLSSSSVLAEELRLEAYGAKTGAKVELVQTKEGTFVLLVDGEEQMELAQVDDGRDGDVIVTSYRGKDETEVEWTYSGGKDETEVEWTYNGGNDEVEVEWTYEEGPEELDLYSVKWTY